MSQNDAKVLVFAPLADDAVGLAGAVEARGLPVQICADADVFLAALAEPPLCALISQEGAGRISPADLKARLADSPNWSTLPLIFLVSDADRPPAICQELERQAAAALVVILQRPLRDASIGSVLESQVLLRRRQFETAALLLKLEEAERYQKFLLSELKHRARNMLSIVQATVRMSAREETDAEQLRKVLLMRLRALSEAHDRLTGSQGGSGALRGILAQHVEPYTPAAGSLEIKGPDVTLEGQRAFDFALIVHEMATNAAKYGALSQAGGKIQVVWHLEAGQLALRWREQGGPAVVPPQRKSFGSRMIEQLARRYGGVSTLSYQPDGLVWDFSLPIGEEGVSAQGP